MHGTVAPRHHSIDLYCRIAAWIVIVAMVFALGIRTAQRFDAWYLARSIAREDTHPRCPIAVTSAWTGSMDEQC